MKKLVILQSATRDLLVSSSERKKKIPGTCKKMKTEIKTTKPMAMIIERIQEVSQIN